MVFWTDQPQQTRDADGNMEGPGLCAMATINNILQMELFTACSYDRQIRTEAFAKRFRARFPGEGGAERLAKMQRLRRTTGLQGIEMEHVMYLTGHTFKVKGWYFDYQSNGAVIADPALDATTPMPTLRYLLDRADRLGAMAIQLSVGTPQFRRGPHGLGWKRYPNGRLNPLSTRGIERVHSWAIRKVGAVWYMLDSNKSPWKHDGNTKFRRGSLPKGWAELRGPQDEDKFQHYVNHTGQTLCLSLRFVTKNAYHNRPHEKVVRGFVEKRRNVKAIRRDARHTNGKNQGIKACGGRDVPVSSYMYRPTPAQQDCKSIQLKYGPGCKTYRKCISEATQWKMRGDEAASHF